MKRLAALFLCVSAMSAQAPAPSPVAYAPVLPAVTFAFDNPQINPTHYEITIDSQGKAVYRSRYNEEIGTVYGDADREFSVAPATKERIFALANAANQFEGDFQFKKHRIAFTGDRTLTYSAADAKHTTSFTWSETPSIQELSSLLEGISATLEAEPRLRHLRRFDRLGLNEQLAKLEKLAQGGWLREAQLLAPVLKELAGDSSVMNIARQRAQRLLALAQSGPQHEPSR